MIRDIPILVSEIKTKANIMIKNSEVGKEIRLSDVSRTLGTLVKLKLVKCINPRKKVGDNGILYKLTSNGEKIRKVIVD